MPSAGRIQLDAVEILEEIELPPGAAEFAVGRKLEPDLLLLPDDFLDLAILDLLKLRRGQSRPWRASTRASLSAAGRNRLPTWSARNGGLVRAVTEPRSPSVMAGMSRRMPASGHPDREPAPSSRSRTTCCHRPTLRRRARRSCAASPTAPPRPARCPPRSRRSRIAATGRTVERGEFRRLVDAPLDVVLLLQRAALRGDEAEHDDLVALRQEPQRLEAAGALGIVFEEIAVVIAPCRAWSRPPARSRPTKSRSSGSCRGRHGW